MVNYGYGPGSPNWDDNKKEVLANRLRDLLLSLGLTRNNGIERGQSCNHEYPDPYIEVEGLYAGVRIRKITKLTDDQEEQLLKEADKIYLEVMQ